MWVNLAEKSARLKRLLLLFTGTLLLFSAEGQNWAAPGATWYYSFMNFGMDGYVKITKTADTVINGKNCDVLLKERWWHDYPNSINYYAVIGKDYTYTDSGVVYYYRQGLFFVLYDFNALVGDSWVVAGWSSSPCSMQDTTYVDSVGATVINSDTLKWMWLRPSLGNYNPDWQFSATGFPSAGKIIEKIGCTGYMFPEPYCVTDLSEGGILRCYTDSSGWTYQSGVVSQCDYYYTGINETEQPFFFSVIPNPSSGTFTVTSAQKISSIGLLNMLGEEMTVPYTVTEPDSVTKFDLSAFPKGVYLVRLISVEGACSIKKIIIQ